MIVSDGRYKGTQHADGQKLITRLVVSGCLVIWIAPGDTASRERAKKSATRQGQAARARGYRG